MKIEKEEGVNTDDLAIIITTSPIRSNPSTQIIDMAIQSIEKEPTLAAVTIYIICDGAKIAQNTGSKYKSGIISPQAQQDYMQFKSIMKQKYQQNARIVIQQRNQRCGFAENIRYIMSKIPHQFVMIFQHDHVIVRPVDFTILIKTMKAHQINYIGLMNRSVFKLPHQLDQNMIVRKYFCQKVTYFPTIVRHDHQQFTKKVLEYYKGIYGIHLMPLLFWYDKVHIARKSYYLNVIFHPYGLYDQTTKSYIKTVSFVEDSFGCLKRKAIRRDPSKFQELCAFIYWDVVQSAIMHSHGRAFMTQQAKQDMYFKNMKVQSDENSDSPQQEINLQFLNQQNQKHQQ